MTRPSPPSSSNTTAPDAFSLLHRDVQRWVWEQRWTSLRPIQEQAIQPIISGNVDVLLAAATAGGKTEAVFLPVCSVLARDADHGEATGIQAVCLSPLKALINDQHARLTALCARIKVPVTAWHGDIGVTQKDRLRGDPAGILLITPESLEAMFVRRGSTVSQLFRDLRYIVVDELHSFLGTARGAQLRSLMNRLEHAAGRRVSRIACPPPSPTCAPPPDSSAPATENRSWSWKTSMAAKNSSSNSAAMWRTCEATPAPA